MRKHQRQLWVSSSQWPGREIRETLFNKLHMAVSIYRGHVSRLNCLFVHWFVVGFHMFSLQNRAIEQVTATSPIYWILLDKIDGTTMHNVSPLFSTAATSHLQHPHLACCWEVPDVILSFKVSGQRVRRSLVLFTFQHNCAGCPTWLAGILSLLDATAPIPSKRWQGL